MDDNERARASAWRARRCVRGATASGGAGETSIIVGVPVPFAVARWGLGTWERRAPRGAASHARRRERTASELGRRNNLYYELSVSTPRRRRRERADPNARSPNPSRGAAGTPITVAWSRSALNIRAKTNFPAATCRHASLHHRIGTTSGSRPARRRGRMRPARSAITTE